MKVERAAVWKEIKNNYCLEGDKTRWLFSERIKKQRLSMENNSKQLLFKEE